MVLFLNGKTILAFRIYDRINNLKNYSKAINKLETKINPRSVSRNFKYKHLGCFLTLLFGLLLSFIRFSLIRPKTHFFFFSIFLRVLSGAWVLRWREDALIVAMSLNLVCFGVSCWDFLGIFEIKFRKILRLQPLLRFRRIVSILISS